jgi:hypothetical protein
MDLGNYTGGGAGFGTSTADQSMAASGTTGSVSSGFSGPSYDSTGGGDNYSNYVAASQPRTGIAAIKDYFTGGGYDYGYQPSLGRTLGGIGNLFLGMVNPVLGGLNYVRKNIGPEFDRFRQAPTLDRYLNPDKYLNQPYIIGSNPMDYQRFNPSQFGQEYNYQRPNGIAGLDISNLYVDASLRNTLDNIFNPNLNVDKALDKEEEKRQREQELLQELRMII